jgi:hypothetical protein
MVEVTEIGHYLVSVPSKLSCVYLNIHGPTALDTTAFITSFTLSVAAPTKPEPFTYESEPCSVIVQYYNV